MHPPRILEGFQFSTGTQISVPDPWGMRRSCVRLSEIFGWSLVLRYGRRPRYESVTLWTPSPSTKVRKRHPLDIFTLQYVGVDLVPTIDSLKQEYVHSPSLYFNIYRITFILSDIRRFVCGAFSKSLARRVSIRWTVSTAIHP